MTYAFAAPLQAAVFQHLSADPNVTSTLGGAIYDALPPGPLPETYALLGVEDVEDVSDATSRASRHRLGINLFTSQPGFEAVKAAAGSICESLQDVSLTLSQGSLTSLRFQRASAQRTADGLRSVALRFSARVEES